MKAFHNDPKVQEKYLMRVKTHYEADEIIKGQYWEEGKGCAVGCTIHSHNHKAYEAELGIPEWLARLEDTLFEGLPDDKAKEWPLKFLSAVNLGSDLDKINSPFLIFILDKNLSYVQQDKFPEVVAVINQCKELQENFIKTGIWSESAAESAESAAWSAAESVAWSVARSAARSAAESVARSAAWSAARSVARSAAWSAAWSAARSAAESVAWSVARSAAESAAYVEYSEKLLELIRECK